MLFYQRVYDILMLFLFMFCLLVHFSVSWWNFVHCFLDDNTVIPGSYFNQSHFWRLDNSSTDILGYWMYIWLYISTPSTSHTISYNHFLAGYTMIKYDIWKILKIPELGFTPPVLSALLESKEVAPGRAKLVGIGTIIGKVSARDVGKSCINNGNIIRNM